RLPLRGTDLGDAARPYVVPACVAVGANVLPERAAEVAEDRGMCGGILACADVGDAAVPHRGPTIVGIGADVFPDLTAEVAEHRIRLDLRHADLGHAAVGDRGPAGIRVRPLVLHEPAVEVAKGRRAVAALQLLEAQSA